ncbi:MAG: class I SAM-dependent RNA methyltransferase [Clostridia bacterium]|nr:class I SAM-dependent RNA methyltransferase [Clostridia bacterium]
MQRMILSVPCPLGTESITAHQVRELGYETSEVVDGCVSFEGDEEAVALANINLRSGERVLIRMGQFKALSFTELFDNVKKLPWENFIGKNDAFPVKGYSLKSKLFSVPDCQSIIKKAIVQRLSEKYNISWFDETGPVYRVQFSIMKDIVSVYIDTTGAPLYKRGYRAEGVLAPLRETLAFSMIDVSRWRGDRPFIDPFCGSGTIPIEAALYALNIAPGINRSFESEKWGMFKEGHAYSDAREEARDNEQRDNKVEIFGSDIDPDAVSLAIANAKKAKVADKIRFFKADVKDVRAFKDKGIVMCNPPYGERLMDKKSVERLYAVMGRKFAEYENASKLILTSYEDFEKFYGRKADKKRKLYNGMLKCNLYMYFPEKTL